MMWLSAWPLVSGDQARPKAVAADGVVDVTVVVHVRPILDDGHGGESAGAAVDLAGLVRDAQRLPIGDLAGGDDVAIDVVATDTRIDVQELLRPDLTGVEGGQAILDADVVQRPAGEPVLGSRPKTLIRSSCQVQRAPPRFVTGS